MRCFFDLSAKGREDKKLGERASVNSRYERRWILNKKPCSGARQIEQELNPYFGTEIHNGEFDPGSERTLAARLKHASRADARPSGREEAADG